MIDGYNEGSRMTVGGETYHNDLKIIDGRVRKQWWRKQGHRLDLDDIRDILSAGPDILVIGTGYAGNLRIPESVRSGIEEQGIRVVDEKTAQAVKTFNRLHAEGKQVAGAFHLTC